MQYSHTEKADDSEESVFYSDYYDEWSEQWDLEDENAMLIEMDGEYIHHTTVLSQEFEESKTTRSDKRMESDTSAIIWQLKLKGS